MWVSSYMIDFKGLFLKPNKIYDVSQEVFWGVCEKGRFLFYSDIKIKQVSTDWCLIVSWVVQRDSIFTS